MKTFRIAILITLMTAAIFQSYSAVHYRLMMKKLTGNAEVLNSQAKTLNGQMEKYSQLPSPVAEIIQEYLRASGFTNINCLVWGEHNGKMTGFKTDSNSVTTMPNIDVRMIEVNPTDMITHRRL